MLCLLWIVVPLSNSIIRVLKFVLPNPGIQLQGRPLQSGRSNELFVAIKKFAHVITAISNMADGESGNRSSHERADSLLRVVHNLLERTDDGREENPVPGTSSGEQHQ